MIVVYILFVLGIYVLVKSADYLIDSSVSLAKRVGVSTLIIGLTVVAFGTSLPEFIINIFALINNSAQVSFGNVIGSNIANVLLIMGILAFIRGVKVRESVVWNEIPFALLVMFVLFVISTKTFFGSPDPYLERSEGIIFLTLFALFLFYIHIITKDKGSYRALIKFGDEENRGIFLKLVLGLIGIYFGGKWVVEGAVLIAGQLGFSEYLISATVIAVGTSLPELVVSIRSVKKKYIDIAVGNVIGSNIFNILWVLGLPAIIKPIPIPPFVGFDIAIMFLSTLLIFIFMFTGEKHALLRREGIILTLSYLMYVVFVLFRG